MASDNLELLIKKCDQLVEHTEFKSLLSKVVSNELIESALKTNVKDKSQLNNTIAALKKVLYGLIAVFPKRVYQKVNETGFIVDPQVEESFNF